MKVIKKESTKVEKEVCFNEKEFISIMADAMSDEMECFFKTCKKADNNEDKKIMLILVDLIIEFSAKTTKRALDKMFNTEGE